MGILFSGHYLLSLGQPPQSVNVITTFDSIDQELCLPPKLPGNITDSQLITASSNGWPVVCEISEGKCWKYNLVNETWAHFADMLTARQNAAVVNINAHDFWVTGKLVVKLIEEN